MIVLLLTLPGLRPLLGVLLLFLGGGRRVAHCPRSSCCSCVVLRCHDRLPRDINYGALMHWETYLRRNLVDATVKLLLFFSSSVSYGPFQYAQRYFPPAGSVLSHSTLTTTTYYYFPSPDRIRTFIRSTPSRLSRIIIAWSSHTFTIATCHVSSYCIKRSTRFARARKQFAEESSLIKSKAKKAEYVPEMVAGVALPATVRTFINSNPSMIVLWTGLRHCNTKQELRWSSMCQERA
jgi:hypothetical protein